MAQAFTLKIVVQLYAHIIVGLLDDLRTLETEVVLWGDPPDADPARVEKAAQTIQNIVGSCEALELGSALKQIRHLAKRVESYEVQSVEFGSMLRELRRRVNEDFEDRIFFCVTNTSKIRRFFKLVAREDGEQPVLVEKYADELFDPSIAARFGAAIDDIEEACRCHVASRYTACVFHLMRVVEVGVRVTAELVELEDPKPSWGAVLQKIEKIAFRTEYKDVPPGIKPNLAILKDLLPRMQAIQHAWRNNVSHVGDKLIPTSSMFTEEVADEIMNATQAFMRKLAADLPPTTVP